MSVCPWQNRTKPSVVPGPLTATLTPEFALWKSCATRELIGSTVEDPEMLREPLKSPPEDPPLSLLHPAATSASTDSATSMRSFFIVIPSRQLCSYRGRRREPAAMLRRRDVRSI